MQKKHSYRGGFALPTVLIASVVMLTILAVSVSSVTAVRTSLKTQYYEQLAKEAGEAGVAYAKACLAKNGNAPLWTNAKPLKPNTDCSGTAISGITCPADARCSVLSNGTTRTSFSVAAPAVNAQGKAVTIPNSGYTELLRGSNGQVWRIYRQPSVQSAVVPDLCSGSATAGLGWSNASAASGARVATIPSATSATTITLADSALPSGQMYFRKDFPVNTSGTYQVSALTNSAKDAVEIYIDGAYVTTSYGSIATATTPLAAGCHTITARLTNKTVLPSYSQFTAAVSQSGSSAPVVGTDTAWRASSGAAVSFASTSFYADPSVWRQAISYGDGQAIGPNPDWSAGGDAHSAMISPPGNGCATACPPESTAYLRDSKDFYVATDTQVTGSVLCDNACTLYIDGEPVMQGDRWNDVTRQSFMLSKGYHRAGIQVYNTTTVANPAGAAMSIVAYGGGTVYSRTDTSWLATSTWHAGTGSNITGYESNFAPSPKEIIDPVKADVLLVGGGGGGGRNAGGGGGGGGLRFIEDFELEARTYNVTIGAGGVGAATNTVAGSNGLGTVFGPYSVGGGGGGASRDAGNAAGSAGTGGGGAGAPIATRVPGGTGILSQGNAGGDGTPADSGVNSTGGGGGGAGSMGKNGASGGAAGIGGAGQIFYFTGNRVAYGGGGGGSITVNGTVGAGTDGAGNGGTTAGGNGAANTGGGGGAGQTGVGGSGGSGVVTVRIKTGSATVSATGSFVYSTVSVQGVSYAIYRFTGNGTLVVSALNPS